MRRSTPVETHSRRRMCLLWVGSVCEEINASWDAESKVVCISSIGEK